MNARYLLIAALLLACACAQAQDYRLPPSMQGQPAPAPKPETDYRIPGQRAAPGPNDPAAVKIIDLHCTVTTMRPGDPQGRATAIGQVRNVSSTLLETVQVEVLWDEGAFTGTRATLSKLPLAPGQSSEFRATGIARADGKKCVARVLVAR